MPDEKPESSESKEHKKELDRILIRPWPKMIFLYPTFILSVVFGILSSADATTGGPGVAFAVYWILVFGANLFVMAFEFNRLRSVAIFCGILAVVMLFLYLGKGSEDSIFSGISSLVMSVKPLANSRFYFSMAGVLLLMFLFMFIHTRLEYWEVTHNELRHHHGLLGNVERFPAPHMRFTKEINDVVEFMLLFSGTLVLYPASESRTIVLENVPHINRVEKNLQTLLSKLAVDIEPG